MPGKNTAKGPHPHPSGGGWAADCHIEISTKAAAALSSALGRDLSPAELADISRALKVQLIAKASHANKVSMQSVKRTLTDIAKCNPDEAREAYLDCDTTTSAEIDYAWHAAGNTALSDIPPDAIPGTAAAALVAVNAVSRAGGAPEKGYHKLLAECCVRLWRSYGGPSNAVWHKDESGELSPLLAWTVTLFLSLIHI